MNRYEIEDIGSNERQPDSVKEFSTSNKELAGSRNIKKPHVQTKNKDDRNQSQHVQCPIQSLKKTIQKLFINISNQ